VSYKLIFLNKVPYFDPQDGQGYFWTESAFHYRHFQMIAEGRQIPLVDFGIQYPEGLDTSRYITPVMEVVAGTIYRVFFSNLPAHLFVVYFSIIFSTLSVIAIFLTAKIAWRSYPVAFACALVYGFTLASLSRSTGDGFVREHFALPFIFFSFACFLDCMREDNWRAGILGSVLFAVALAAWHVTQLYLTLFMVALIAVYFVTQEKDLLRHSLPILMASLAAAALLFPVLRAKYFIFSPALMLGFAFLIVTRTSPFNKKRSIFTQGLVIGCFLIISLFIQKLLGTHSHVYELLFAKIRFLGRPPQDFAGLSFESRVMWTSAFVSPRLSELPIMLSTSLLFGPAGLALLTKRLLKKNAEAHEVMIAFFTVCFFIFFLMIHRMSIFAVFFMVLSIGALSLLQKAGFKYAAYIILIVCLFVQFSMQSSLKLVASRPNHNDLRRLTAFIKNKTPADTPVLTTFQLGPSIAAYAGQPVILHSKFESRLLRDKVKQVYTSLYRTEDEFLELCKRLQAGLFVYQVNMVHGATPASMRYVAGAIPLKTNSAAFLFHFAPERLEHFKLIYQNATYRLYRVGKKTRSIPTETVYQPIYDADFFFADGKIGQVVDDSVLQSGLDKLGYAATHQQIADRLMAEEEYESAALQYRRALMIEPRNLKIIGGLARALNKTGDDDNLLKVIRGVLSMDPNYDVFALDIRNVDIWLALGNDELADEHFDKSEKLFKRALSCDPRNHRTYENLGKVYVARGETQKAIRYVQKSLFLNPSQPQLEQILILLKKEMLNKSRS
jgi:tetratricopeptide (TPR) repeat protein